MDKKENAIMPNSLTRLDQHHVYGIVEQWTRKSNENKQRKQRVENENSSSINRD